MLDSKLDKIELEDMRLSNSQKSKMRQIILNSDYQLKYYKERTKKVYGIDSSKINIDYNKKKFKKTNRRKMSDNKVT